MKPKFFSIMIILFILCIIAGAIYFIVRNRSGNIEKTSEIKYETINILTSIKLGISEFDSIHPYITNNREVININQLIFEPLLSITQNYDVTNCLAKEWSKVGEKEYVIKLKENVKWSDGEELTAKDIQFSIGTLKENKKSIYYENVKNINKVEIVDKYTIRIELKEEIPFFEYYLIFPIIYSKQYISTTIQNSKQIPIGTGQYKIKKIEEDKIELIKNNEWRDIEVENANINTITIYLYETMGEIYNDFKIGRIDLLHSMNPDIENYIGTMGYGQEKYIGREYEFLAFNCKNNILQYPEVRKAIQTTIDQEKIVASSLESKVYVSYFPIGKENYLIQNVELLHKPNLEKAQKILTEAGWKYEYGIWQKEIQGSTKTLNLKLSVTKSNKQRVKVAEEIKRQLEELGIKVIIEQISNGMYENYISNHRYEMMLTGIYTPLSPDLTSFFGQDNLANYENQEINTILAELNNITDKKLLKEKYKKILEIYQNEVPYIGLYRNQNLVAYTTRFRGEISPNNYSIYYNFSKWYHHN